MLKESLLLYRIGACGRQILPRFLREDDHPLLRALLDEHDRMVGRRLRELEERLAQPLAGPGKVARQRLATHVLLKNVQPEGRAVIPPREARATLFAAAARSQAGRDAVLEEVAASLAIRRELLEEALFADLPSEKRVTPLPMALSPGELALRINLLLTQALLFRATTVRIEVLGNARALVRHARLRGLLCIVTPSSQGHDAVLHLSGPYALFRSTLLYGRALAGIVPLLSWSKRFRLDAECVLRERRLLLTLGLGEPIFPAAEPRRYDSRLEERFARDFRRAAPDWDIIREPEPVAAGEMLVFPDFALVHRRDPARRFLLEIVGFWTPEYIARKLHSYRQAQLGNLILCIDEERNCGQAELPIGAKVLRFRKRVDPRAVLSLIEGFPNGLHQ